MSNSSNSKKISSFWKKVECFSAFIFEQNSDFTWWQRALYPHCQLSLPHLLFHLPDLFPVLCDCLKNYVLSKTLRTQDLHTLYVVILNIPIHMGGLSNTPLTLVGVFSSPAFWLLVSLSFSITSIAIGIIMAVVAVLLIHMDRNHVGNMNPRINLSM